MKNSIVFLFLFFCESLLSQNAYEISSKDFQNNLNKEFLDPKESPLDKEDFKKFKGLDFFPINEKFIVKAKLVKSENEKEFEMKTTTDRLPKYIKYGELSFEIEGKSFRLNVYKNISLSLKSGYEDYLFIPFFDLTNGNETYIGGRYIDFRIPKEFNNVIIDFNKAYNPYCAYNHKFSCPLVPLENNLEIEIKAGVKKFH
ncbi:MAG: DUF1684 domain-containing protein [Limnohabitans sp.]|nr:DUF1684 domain-containing protein [Limnohabitans sp.]